MMDTEDLSACINTLQQAADRFAHHIISLGASSGEQSATEKTAQAVVSVGVHPDQDGSSLDGRVPRAATSRVSRWSLTRKLPKLGPLRHDSTVEEFPSWRGKFILYANVNSFQRVLRGDVQADMDRVKPSDAVVAAVRSIDSCAYSKIARWAFHQACHDSSFSTVLSRPGGVADGWKDLENESIPSRSHHISIFRWLPSPIAVSRAMNRLCPILMESNGSEEH